jgi:hypothetical protein
MRGARSSSSSAYTGGERIAEIYVNNDNDDDEVTASLKHAARTAPTVFTYAESISHLLTEGKQPLSKKSLKFYTRG